MKKLFVLLFIIITLFLSCAKTFATENNGKEINWKPYMDTLQKKLKANWNPPKKDKSYQVIVLFDVYKNGSAKNFKIKESSGYTEVDAAAKEAFEKSLPFEAMPEAFTGNFLTIQFNFDYKLFGQSPQSMRSSSSFGENVVKNMKILDYEKPIDKSAQKEYKTFYKQTKYALNTMAFGQYQKPLSIVVNFDVTKKGELKNVKIVKSSGNKSFNEIALKQLNNVDFPPIPESLNKDQINIDCKVETIRANNYNYYPLLLPLFIPIGF